MNLFILKEKINRLLSLIGLVREDKGSRSEAPSLKPKAWKITYPETPVDYNEFHQNINKQIRKYYDTETSN
jgi:hypothetical protein